MKSANFTGVCMLPLVASASEAIVGIKAFNKSRGKYQDVMPHARSWYAYEDDGDSVLGPSKVVGYRGMTPELYFENNATALDGRATESALKPISEPVPVGSVKHRELLRMLSDLCALFGTKPNKLVRFAIIKEDGAQSRDGGGERFAELVAGAYLRMSAKEQSLFRRLAGLAAA